MENYLFYNTITVKIYSFDYTVQYGFYHINVISSYLSILYIDYENEKYIYYSSTHSFWVTHKFRLFWLYITIGKGKGSSTCFPLLCKVLHATAACSCLGYFHVLSDSLVVLDFRLSSDFVPPIFNSWHVLISSHLNHLFQWETHLISQAYYYLNLSQKEISVFGF
jgi:hypothetical protein